MTSDGYRSGRRGLELVTGRSRAFAIGLRAFVVIYGIWCGSVTAQVPDEIAPPEVASAMVDRAEQFAKEVAQLAPSLPVADPDWIQAWPRSGQYRFFDRETGKWYVRERSKETKVFGHELSGAPGKGRAWQVFLYGGELRFSIDSGTGSIRSFHDTILSTVLNSEDAPADDACISSEIAEARGEAYLRAARIDLREFAIRFVKRYDKAIPARASSRVFELTWERSYQGVPFMGQTINVELDAGAGRLLWFGAALSLSPPSAMRFEYSPERAAAAASMYLGTHGKSAIGAPRTALKIVMPNDFWTSGKEMVTTRDPNTRLAWIVTYQVVNTQHPDVPRWAEVWVDAASGAVIGGNFYGLLGSASPEMLKRVIERKLGVSTRLELRPAGGGAGVSLAARPDPLRYYGALSGVTLLTGAEKPQTFTATHRLSAYSSQGECTTFEYDSRAGLIRYSDGSVVRAGSALKKLLDSASKSSQ